MSLNARQHDILSLIAHHTSFREGDASNETIAHFNPSASQCSYYCPRLKAMYPVELSNSGRTIHALLKKGLLAHRKDPRGYAITEEGLLQIEKHRESERVRYLEQIPGLPRKGDDL